MKYVEISIQCEDGSGCSGYKLYAPNGALKWLDDSDVEHLIGKTRMRDFANGVSDFRVNAEKLHEMFIEQDKARKLLVSRHV